MRFLLFGVGLLALSACSTNWNNPYPADTAAANTLYTAFLQRPKHLDPVQSYTESEAVFIYQIYEPPLQYHYLKRPYELIPATATEVPEPVFYDRSGRRLPSAADRKQVAFSVYDIRIRPGIYYQPHPAFAKRADGTPVYNNLTKADLRGKRTLNDFPETGTRELEAGDYVYQIKRLAHPRLHSPIAEWMGNYIVGLNEFQETLAQAAARLPRDAWLDLDRFTFDGVQVLDRYTYRIRIRGVYPQFRYWLAMHFFSPVPREVDRFFSQPGMADNNLTLDWYPVGTGPYMMVENQPNRRIVLTRNPNFRRELYPAEGEAGDREAGLLKDAGKPLPFIDNVVFIHEKEGIPYWNKFLQGYYDASGVASSEFDRVIQFDAGGEAQLSPDIRERGIRLLTSVMPNVFYVGFNLRDPVVGGQTAAARKLRQAISIAYDQEEYISIFLNGRGMAAQGPIPPGIFGFQTGKAGINTQVYDWIDGRPVRKSIETARQLMAEAGYPYGRHVKTGQPLVLNLDIVGNDVGAKSFLDWLTKQFAKIDIQLNVRTSDFNRFQDKLRDGNAQIYSLGWNADYPDPENFLFLLYGPQARAVSQGENSSNYQNPRFDALFGQMKQLPNGPERQAIIDHMVDIVRHDAPWIWGFHEKSYVLVHDWLKNRKPGLLIQNTLKYQRLDPEMRAARRIAWNQPAWWPFVWIVGLLLGGAWAAARLFAAKTKATPLAGEKSV